jgi:hypothetical protein
VGNGLEVAGGRLDGGAGAVGLAYCDLRGVHMGARGPDMRAGGAFDAVGVCVDWTGSGHARRRFRLGGFMRTWLWFHGNGAVQIGFGSHAGGRSSRSLCE